MQLFDMINLNKVIFTIKGDIMWILECIILMQCIICIKIILNLFNVFDITGKEYLKIAYCKEYENLKYFSFSLIRTIVILSIQFYFMIKNPNIILVASILIMFALSIIASIGMRDRFGVITSKGCWHVNGFCSWRIIKEYKWIKEDCIEFYGVSKFGIDVVYRIGNVIIPKQDLENILEKFIK